MTAAEFKMLVQKEDKRKPRKAKIRMPKLTSPNKTEQEFLDRAASLLPEFRPDLLVQFEPLTLILPSGARYTPDFVFWDGPKIVAVVETKGAHIHSPAALLRFKEARATFRHIQFYFAQKLGKDDWVVEAG